MKTLHIKTSGMSNPDAEPADNQALPRLCIISSGMEKDCSGQMLGKLMKNLPAALPCIIQIREKQLSAASLFSLSLAVKEMAKNTRALIILNERIDIAAAVGLDGIHLQESSCPPDKLTALRGDLLTGKSAHSLESALDAEQRGVDYLIFGPVFDTPSKRRYGSPQGLDMLGTVCRAVRVPVFAIGGVTHENAHRCLSEGAYGIAALSLFNDTADIPGILSTLEPMLH